VHLVGGTCAFWGALVLGERYGRAKDREIKLGLRDPNARKSLYFEDHEFLEVLKNTNKDYHEALKEYMMN